MSKINDFSKEVKKRIENEDYKFHLFSKKLKSIGIV